MIAPLLAKLHGWVLTVHYRRRLRAAIHDTASAWARRAEGEGALYLQVAEFVPTALALYGERYPALLAQPHWTEFAITEGVMKGGPYGEDHRFEIQMGVLAEL